MKSVLSRKIQGVTALVGLAILLVLFWAFTSKAQSTTFTQSMDISSSGAHVKALQSYLATTPHYPEKLVTGYFGPLTQAAVQRFQCAEEIVCSGTPGTTGYGRVGPKTLMQLNLRVGGYIEGDVSAPSIGGVAVSAISQNSATVIFTTNELASGKVYYANSPLTLSEGIGFATVTGGASAMADTNARTVHAITLTGLAPDTTYFYVIQVVDVRENMNFTWPATFKTNR